MRWVCGAISSAHFLQANGIILDLALQFPLIYFSAPLGRGLAAGPEIARPEAMSRSYRAEWGAAGRDPAPGSGLALGLLECPVKGRANPARAVGAAIDWRLC